MVVNASPSLWSHHCSVCGAFLANMPWPDEHGITHRGCPHGKVRYPPGRGRLRWPRAKVCALWGHEWAAVAWMVKERRLRLLAERTLKLFEEMYG